VVTEEFTDIVIVGGGMAGISAGAELSAHARVTVLEMETQPGYHATGRSAAYFATAYGRREVRELTAACEGFLSQPPPGFTEVDLLRPRDCMFFARPDQAASLEAMLADNPSLEFLDADAVRARVPVFADGYLLGSAWDRRGGDLDVDALLQGYLRLLRSRGGVLRTDCPVAGLEHDGQSWRVTAGDVVHRAAVVVNAAGGWAERIGKLAGLAPLGIEPYRRTGLTIDPPSGIDVGSWPEMVDVDEEFYFKPDAGRIMISPADETLTPPCDAQPEDIDVATGVDRFERATGLEVGRVRSCWAGMRTFAPDRLFVVGFDPRSTGFFWLAGQGGYGIQSAPALAPLTTCLITGVEPEGDFSNVGKFAGALAPDRLLA
jgi:D-arginine dehydrogenase